MPGWAAVGGQRAGVPGLALAGVICGLVLGACVQLKSQAPGQSQPATTSADRSPIRFRYQPIDFVLDNCETDRRHAPETMAGGVAVFDYDNDGDLDIYFLNGADIYTQKKTGPNYWNRLFANDGRGRFADVTARAGLAGRGYDTGVAVADYDNDGDQDIFIGGVYGYTLYRNNGDGTFTDVTVEAGIGQAYDPQFGKLWSVGGAWLDYDRDGWLDLFVTNYLSWDPKTEPVCQYEGHAEYCHPRLYKELPNRLYRNNRDGTFTDISEQVGLRAFPGKGMGACVADFDQDGWPDVFVANDKLFNFLFHNVAGRRFEEIAFDAGVALPEHGNFISGMGVDCRDVDNDGLIDIAFVALDNETFPLFRNTGKNLFEELTARSGITRQSRRMAGYSPALYDFDNDGWKDLFVSRGHVQSPLMRGRVEIDQHNTVFRNLGQGRFEALTEEAGFAVVPPKRHRGSAHGDLNGDGKVDLVVSALRAPAEVWINESPAGHHWLAVNLEGTVSNRDGIGAVIKVTTPAGVQYNHKTTAVGYASSSSTPVYFGLGTATRAVVEIWWPSGIRQALGQVQVDQILHVREPQAGRESK